MEDPLKHLGLVAETAWRLRGAGRANGLDLDDLKQEGFIGLMVACERFDPSREFEFSTYAVDWIVNAILKAANNQARPVRIPVYLRKQVFKLRKQVIAGVEPDLSGLSRTRRATLRAATLLMSGEHVGIELNTALSADAETRHADAAAEFAEVSPRLAKLPERDRLILSKRFGLDGEPPRSRSQIGESLRLTRERIRQIEVKALERLRETG